MRTAPNNFVKDTHCATKLDTKAYVRAGYRAHTSFHPGLANDILRGNVCAHATTEGANFGL